jgi:hypothetical protein
MRFRRALDRGNVIEALSAAAELQFVGLAEALELTLLLAEGESEKYDRAAVRWHVRFLQETKNVDLRQDNDGSDHGEPCEDPPQAGHPSLLSNLPTASSVRSDAFCAN